jgi:hypothetical protein
MSGDPPVLEMASTAAAAGGAGRVLLALHGGERRWVILLIEAGLGALLGVIAASAVTYFDPALRDAGWGLLIVGGAAGLSGALGTRLLDLVVAGLQRRLGS